MQIVLLTPPGSNNGMAAAYFLAQHRRQLGSKSIWKVRVFTSDTSSIGTPNILFYVDNGENSPPTVGPGHGTGKKSLDRPNDQMSTKKKLRRHKARKFNFGEL